MVVVGLATLPEIAARAAGDWTPLFNGHDFSGWVVPAGRGAAPGSPPQNPADVGWTIKDGVIVGGQPPPGQRGGSLVSQAQFKDVELEFDFTLAEHGARCSAEVVGPNQPQRMWDRCRDGLIECAAWADDRGVTLALQNHPPVIHDGHEMLRMIREVGSPALKACFDAPLARKQSVVSMQQAVAEVGALQVLTHFGGEYDRGRPSRGQLRAASG